MYRNTRAGFPALTALAGTSRVTTLPAPIIAFSPMITLERMVEPDPIEAPRFTQVCSTFQSRSVCSWPVSVCGAWVRIIDERDVMANKHVILKAHPFADKRVARDLAVCTDERVLLDFYKGADLGCSARFHTRRD